VEGVGLSGDGSFDGSRTWKNVLILRTFEDGTATTLLLLWVLLLLLPRVELAKATAPVATAALVVEAAPAATAAAAAAATIAMLAAPEETLLVPLVPVDDCVNCESAAMETKTGKEWMYVPAVSHTYTS
jgi:hypothetical protein